MCSLLGGGLRLWSVKLVCPALQFSSFVVGDDATRFTIAAQVPSCVLDQRLRTQSPVTCSGLLKPYMYAATHLALRVCTVQGEGDPARCLPMCGAAVARTPPWQVIYFFFLLEDVVTG